MCALVIIMSIGTKPHFKREAVRDTAGIGTREWQRTGPPICVWHRAPQELNPALGLAFQLGEGNWVTCVKLRPTFNIWHSILQKPIPRDVWSIMSLYYNCKMPPNAHGVSQLEKTSCSADRVARDKTLCRTRVESSNTRKSYRLCSKFS